MGVKRGPRANVILTQTSHSGLLNLSVAFSHPNLLFSSGKNEGAKDVTLSLIKNRRFFLTT